MSFLEVSHLSKAYGGLQALNDVTFTLHPGESVGVVGDNGAGKSTLLKCLSGVIKPDAGHITFENRPLPLGTSQAVRAVGIEMVYQDLALCRGQNVVTNLFLGREMTTRWGLLDHAAMHRAGTQTLAKLNADISMDAIVGTLSGGQQQAVAIARAMLSNPKLVIFDEPTAALGFKESQRVILLIQALTAQGVAVIVVSHRLADVIQTTSRILVMRQGQVAKAVATKDVTAAELVEEM
jgi:ABC-type sugar transport system ATPase subunit